MKRVLVTGASGFIGRHTLAPLVARGFDVHAVGRTRPAGAPAGVTWHAADLLAPGAAAALVGEVKPTHLLHLAWFVVPGKLITAPENFEWVTASFELVRRFHEAGGTRVAVCGSGYEYDWSYGYCTEGLTPCVPDTVYGACKHALHELVRSYAIGKSLSWAWPRVFFLYGPGEHPQRLVSSVARALLAGEPAKSSHGRQIRDYMHVQDVADGLAAVLDADVQGAVNVSSGQATTLREIVLGLGRITGRPELVQLGALPARANDVPLVVGANAKAAALGWAPRYDLEAGLAHTVDWWRGQA
ncbi:MAG: NAD(P)-dependent oxidoreductase [Anaeromyxobacteraceae bacterium]